MDILSTVINYFTNPTIKRRNKFFLPLCVLGLILIVNDITGFAFYYSNARKIEQVHQITEILNDDIPIDQKYELECLRYKILRGHSNIAYWLGVNNNDYLQKIERSTLSATSTIHSNTIAIPDIVIAPSKPTANDSTMSIIYGDDARPITHARTNTPIETNPHNAVNKTNRALFFASSSGVYLLLFILTCVIIFTDKTYNYNVETGEQIIDEARSSFTYRLGALILALFIFTILAFLSYLLMGLFFTFPIFNRWWATYVMVFIFSLLPPYVILLPPFLMARRT